MTETNTPRRISKPRLALMIAIDVVAVAVAVGLYMFLESRDPDAALMGLIAPLVFGAFFNLVIVLVSLKP
jgi:membrane protein YdbS with pleckstrin-like domain